VPSFKWYLRSARNALDGVTLEQLCVVYLKGRWEVPALGGAVSFVCLGLIEVIRKDHLTLRLLLPCVGSLVDMPLGTGTL